MSGPENYRMLCMDGGGIYGYFTVLMLRNLAQRYDNFLTKRHISAFAGTSAGALISMLLAKEENPREYLRMRRPRSSYCMVREGALGVDTLDEPGDKNPAQVVRF